MTTTAVFAEIIVVGLEAEAWLALLILAIFGADWVDIGALDEWTALVTILVLAVAYVLGIIVDRVADTVVSPLGKRPASARTPASGKNGRDDDAGGTGFQDKRLLILYKSGGDGMAKFLDYQRSRMRVARGTVLNTAIAIPAVVAFLTAETDASFGWIVGAALTGVFVLAVAFHVNGRINHAYQKNLEAAYSIVLRA